MYTLRKMWGYKVKIYLFGNLNKHEIIIKIISGLIHIHLLGLYYIICLTLNKHQYRHQIQAPIWGIWPLIQNQMQAPIRSLQTPNASTNTITTNTKCKGQCKLWCNHHCHRQCKPHYKRHCKHQYKRKYKIAVLKIKDMGTCSAVCRIRTIFKLPLCALQTKLINNSNNKVWCSAL